MGGFNYVNRVSFHVGYNSDVEELFDLYKIKKRKRFKVNVAAKKAVETGPAKIGKIIMDDQVEILLANIHNDSYCDIGYDLEEVWTTYLESQPELLNYENLTDFEWRLDTILTKFSTKMTPSIVSPLGRKQTALKFARKLERYLRI